MRCTKSTLLLCSTLALGCAADETSEGDVEALSTARTEPLHLVRAPVSDGATEDGSTTLSFDLDGLSLVASAHVDLHVRERAEGRVVQRVVAIDEDGAEVSLGDVEVPAFGHTLRVDVTDVVNDALAGGALGAGTLELELRPIVGGAVRWSLSSDELLFRPQLVVEPLRDRFRRSQSPEADAYIVVLDDEAVASEGVDAIADELLATYGAEEEHRYRTAIRGMGVVMSEASAIAMAGDPRVAYVEESTTVATDTPVDRGDTDDLVAPQDVGDPLAVIQNAPGWALDRIDEHALPLNGVYDYPTTGAGVEIHVMDSGVFPFEPSLAGRVTVRQMLAGEVSWDCKGHGTRVASVAAGATHGVAKGAQIHSWQISSCTQGLNEAGIIATIDQITAVAGQRAVANWSGGLTGTSAALDTAIGNSMAGGVIWVLAAGNVTVTAPAVDACSFSPQRVAQAIVVGASTSTDAMASFSRRGACVDIFAPGQDVDVATVTGPGVASGTSFSAPLVSGAIARTLATYSTMTQGQASTLLSVFGTNNVLTGIPAGTVNRLLWIPGTDQAPDQNPLHPMDVNNDGFVAPIDSLLIINYINAGGAAVPPAGAPFFDVNGDGVVAPIDVLLITNYLNAV